MSLGEPIPAVRVFVSSTWLDLRPERQAVETVLHAFRDTKFMGMEYFGSQDSPAQPASLAEVERSSLFLLVIGNRYGSGITEAEYRRARELHLPCRVYVKKADTVPDGERSETEAKLDALEAELRSAHLVSEFASPDELGRMVATDLHNWLFDEFLSPRLQSALWDPAGGTKAGNLLGAVRDMNALSAPLVSRLAAAGYDVGVTGSPVCPAGSSETKALWMLAERVRQGWIKGVLESSIHAEALLTLGKESAPEAVDHPWERFAEVPGHPDYALARERAILELFRDACGFLLILGEPGSGKTTTLLELARELLSEADTRPDLPVPVVLNVSSWSRGSFIDWVVEELRTAYFVPRREGRSLVTRQRLMLLLDGLDEVQGGSRQGCVDAINEFLKEYGAPGMVVACRREEYSVLDRNLKLYAAVRLQPLSEEEVLRRIDAAGSPLAGLRADLEADSELREQARNPLMLSIMILAFERGEEMAAPLAPVSVQQKVFSQYVKRMFHRKPVGKVSESDTRRLLTWLAGHMSRDSSSVFALDRLQPSWLGSVLGRLAYTLVPPITTGLVVGFIVAYGSSLSDVWLGLAAGGAGAIVDATRLFTPLGSSWLVGQRPTLMKIRDFILYGALTGLTLTLLTDVDPWTVLLTSFIFTVVYGLSSAGRDRENDVQMADRLKWSWRGAAKGMLIAFVIANVLSAVFCSSSCKDAASDIVTHFSDLPGLLGGEIIALESILVVLGLGALLGGLRPAASLRPSGPRERIRLTTRYASIAAGIGLVILGVANMDNPFDAALDRIPWDAILGILMAMAVPALLYGGIDLLRHYLLRSILWLAEGGPLRYVDFLEEATRLILLRRVGGSYIFVHRMLLEHFAQFTPPTLEAAQATPQ